MPAVPFCLLEPLWDQFAALLPAQEGYSVGHPLGCHRRRVPDRVVFEHVVLALVHGSGYERIASPGCSDRTIRRRVKQSGKAVDFYLHLAAALVTLRRLVRRATKRHRWDGRPTTRRLK